MTEIRVLVYTDTKEVSADDKNERFCISMLRDLLEGYESQFVKFKLTVVNRYKGAQPDKVPTPVRIDEGLLKDFDQVWFFGYNQINTRAATFHILFGSDQNELREDEVKALETRMNDHRLGVLISGDHSSSSPLGEENDPVEKFICLGKAIGFHVPRAKQLRKWDGPPVGKKGPNAFNTLADAAPRLVAPESDTTPQRLALFNFAVSGVGLQPHRLFWGKDERGQDKTIDVLPDHQHEGEVVAPASLDPDWPPSSEPDGTKKQPRPVVIALGFDRGLNRAVPVLAVYDGDPHNVGRIVADSSWHHFFDLNLLEISIDKSPGSAFDLIGQFYRNLAHYLAPLEKRREIAKAMMKWAMTHPGVLEERDNDSVHLGRVTRYYLSKVATPFEIGEMLNVKTPDDERLTDSHAEFATLGSGETNLLPTQEEVIGHVVSLYYRAASEQLKAQSAGPQLTDSAAQPLDEDEVIEQGFREAFSLHRERLAQLASTSQDFSDRLQRAGMTKEVMMATVCGLGTEKWERSKRKGVVEGHFEITKHQDGSFTGTYTDKDGVTTLKNVKCGGVGGTLSFDREKNKKDIFYSGTITQVSAESFKVDGTFKEKSKPTPAGQTKGRKKDKDDAGPNADDSGDWSAEKPGD